MTAGGNSPAYNESDKINAERLSYQICYLSNTSTLFPDHIETLEDSIVPWGYCTGGIYEYFVYHPSASPTAKAYITTQIRPCDLTPWF